MSELPPSPEEFHPVSVHTPERRSSWWIWPVLFVVIIVDFALFWAGSHTNDKNTQQELITLAASGLEVIPFLPLIVFAQAGNTSPSARALAFGYWMFFSLVAVITTSLFTLSGVFDFGLAERLPPNKSIEAIQPGGLVKAGQALLIGFAGMAAGIIAFTSGGRAVASRLIPIQPNSFTSATALATTIVLIMVCFIPLVLLHEPPILALIRTLKDSKDADALTVDTSVRSLYYRLVWTVPVAIIAAGFPLTRGFRSAIARLGLQRLSIGQFVVTVGIAVILLAAMLGIESAVGRIWDKFGWPKTDEHGLEELFKFATSHLGALAVGITAGISEELAFRGLLQPRLGLLVSNILFTAVHAFQYNWDALLLVFVIGLVCGLVRKFSNTTAAVIVHGLYDTLAVLWYVMQQQAG
jgi:membrane protease YdiL (CAAX protease family)